MELGSTAASYDILKSSGNFFISVNPELRSWNGPSLYVFCVRVLFFESAPGIGKVEHWLASSPPGDSSAEKGGFGRGEVLHAKPIDVEFGFEISDALFDEGAPVILNGKMLGFESHPLRQFRQLAAGFSTHDFLPKHIRLPYPF